jgi:O-antigen/teichoic acid export membrane protein
MPMLPEVRSEATPAASTAAELAGRSVLYGFAGVAGKLAALVTVPYLARQLGPGDYGLADLATSTAALVGLVAMFAGDVSAARRAGMAPTADERAMALRMYVVATAVVAIAAAVVLLPLGGLIAGGLWSTQGQAGLAALAIILVPVSAIQAALANVPRLTGHGRQHAGLALVDLGAQLALAVLFVALGMGPTGVVAGFVAGSLIGLLAAAWPARRLLAGPMDAGLGLRLVREGAPFLPALVLPVVADFGTRVILASQLSTSEVGLFGVAIRVASVMSLVAGAFTSAYGPELLGRQYSLATVASFRRVFVSYVTTLAATAVIVSVWAPEIIAVVAGAGFADAGLMLPWLAAAGAAAGSYALLMLAAGVGDRTGSVAWTAALGAASQLVLVAWLIGPLGAVSSGMAVLLGQLMAVALLHRAIASRMPGIAGALAILLVGVVLCAVVVLLHEVGAGIVVRSAVTLVIGVIGAVVIARTVGASRRDGRRPEAAG